MGPITAGRVMFDQGGLCDHVVRKGIGRVGNKASGSRVPGRRAECREGGDGEMGDGGI